MTITIEQDSLGFLLSDSARLMRSNLERRIAGIGLNVTPSEARALIYIAANEGARQSTIAERMGVEPMTVCGYVEKLEKCGLVSRLADPTDRRAKNVRITDAAGGIIAAVREEAQDLYRQALAGLQPEESAALISALRTIRVNLLDLMGDRPDGKLSIAENEVQT
jgi:MarR family transcriptional regulator for hemolysin